MDGSTFSSPISYRRDTILNIPSEGDTSARLAVTIKELKEAYGHWQTRDHGRSE